MNEVLTYAQDYDLVPGATAFVESFLKTQQNSQLTVIFKNLKPGLLDYLKSKSVNLVDATEYDQKYKVTDLSPYTLKIIYYHLYIKRACKSDNLFVSDFTDVYFLKDPFTLLEDKISVFNEDEIFEKCPTNLTWLKLCYEQSVVSSLLEKTIINSGVVLGSRQNFIEHFSKMVDEIKYVVGRIGNYPTIDQTIHNKVVYTNPEKYSNHSDHRIINFAHYISKYKYDGPTDSTVVLHQYNRLETLRSEIYEKYLL
jgi:hypothetical protein